MSPTHTHAHAHKPTPLLAVCAVTFLASIGTGVVWNGVAFIAKHDYGFSEQRTLALYAVLGATYVIGAFSTGPVLRMIRTWIAPRSALAIILTLEAIVCAALWLTKADWMLWLVACSISVLSSWLWPIIESYLTAGRHGAQMRNAIGFWNLSWTGATAIALVLMMPVMQPEPTVLNLFGGGAIRLEPRMAIVFLGLLHLAALVPLLLFERFPGSHDTHEADASITAEYPFLLRSARLLLPLSYVLNSAMSPLLPYLFDRIDLAQQYETTVASTWMWVRIIAMAIMWRLAFWHGRWGTLLVGALAMAIGFGLVLTGYSIAVMVCGLALFGVGLGIIYYAALYYAMSVGKAEVEAGGTHEALIGVGYTVGPIAGIAGLTAGSAIRRTGWPLWDGTGVVVVVWLIFGMATFAAYQPYRAARKLRR
jgi:hypothetical protein